PDSSGRHPQRLACLREALGRRGNRNRIRVADVVREPHRHAPGSGPLQRASHERLALARQVEVVEREVERRPRRTQELGHPPGDVRRALPAVRERPMRDHPSIMDFADVLRVRKAVRNYLPDPIPRETVERIVARGRKAPSGGFSQGLRLVVVTDTETRGSLATMAGEPEYVELGFEPWISRA